MGDGTNSKYFDLDTGRAQGDNLSPNIFNFCEQILIFKLELDMRIEKIPRNFQPIPNEVEEVYSAEANRETCSNESLADDNTVLFMLGKLPITTIKNILNDFAAFSGLHCNFDKTCLMPINPINQQEEEWALEAGFTVVNSIKLLGADISTDYSEINGNFVRIKNKIVNLINFWSRFRLTLPGRVTIAKTFLISQLNYLGSVFVPDNNMLQEIQSLINNFIRKNIRISDERIYLSPKLGGIGFFNISEFLGAQRATWLLKAKKKCIDNWRYDLRLLAPNNDVLLCRLRDVCQRSHPVLYGIVSAYVEFYHSFSKEGKNFWDAQIFENDIFRDTETNYMLTDQFFGREIYNNNVNCLRELTYRQCVSERGFKTLHEFRAMNLRLNLATWMRLRNALLRGGRANVPPPTIGVSIHSYCTRWRKGSKYMRKVIRRVKEINVHAFESRCFITYSRLVRTTLDPDWDIGDWYSSWSINALPNDFRMFMFNSRNNSLPLNNRVNAYIEEVDPSCTFCRMLGALPAPRDSLIHCFLECPYTNMLLNNFLAQIGMGGTDLASIDFRLLYWYGKFVNVPTTSLNKILMIAIFDCFRFLLFKGRQRKRVLTFRVFMDELIFFVKFICRFNRTLKNAFQSGLSGTILARAIG
jgi:hypothetical protein